MTDKAIASNFSFRMFDLYRRFVEVLQLFPDYLQDFKTGSPKEEICHNIIKQVFKYPQTNDKVLQLTKYLSKNSKVIAAHAEDVPVNWKDAIKYTETCIKLVRRYLKKKGINMKDDMDSIEDIATEIGECLHINPNEKQIEAIKEFLKHDLENPKNSIASLGVKKLRNKTNKIVKPTDLVENVDIAEVKRNSLKMVIKRMSGGDSSQTQTENSFCNKSLSVEVGSSNNEESFLENQKQSYETVLENEHKKKSHHEVTNDVQEQFKSPQGEELSFNQPDDSEDIKYLLDDNMKSYCPKDEYIIIEFNDQTTPFLDGVEEQFEISSLSVIPDQNLSKKRKSSISLEDDPDCIKKLFLSDESLTDTQNLQNEYVTISYNDNNNVQDHESVQESFLDTADNVCKNYHDTSNSEIIVVDDDCYDDQLTPNEKFYTNIQIENKPSNHIKEDVLDSHNELLQDKKEEYIVKNETKYLDVLNMSYAKALELIETIMCFCELRNEVSLEEFLVLRRTRDKIHWQSLKEIHEN